jgi:hypothetical protein
LREKAKSGKIKEEILKQVQDGTTHYFPLLWGLVPSIPEG